MTDTGVAEIVKTDTRLKEPSLFNVIYFNDEVTSMQFVVDTLIRHFEYSDEMAFDKMNEIHEKGSGVVATLPYEMAEQKGIEVTLEARNLGFPLEVKVQPS